MNINKLTKANQSIPQEINIISWAADSDCLGHTMYACRTGHKLNLVWMLSSPICQISEDDLLVLIGDNEYAALMRAEDQGSNLAGEVAQLKRELADKTAIINAASLAVMSARRAANRVW